jgi:hypothetical protein
MEAETDQDENDTQEEGEVETEEEPVEKATTEPEDDEAFLESQKGKSIPFPAFQKKYSKWKERHRTAEERAAAAEKKLAEMEKSGTITGEEKVKLQRLMDVFGHFDQAAKNKPWLAQALMSLGQGKEPDWKVLHQALGGHLEAAPNIDPRFAQQLEETQARVREMETAALAREFEAHVTRENAEIAKILDDDDGLMDVLNEWAEKLAPETGTIADLPNRVEMAKRLAAWADKRTQRTLKKQIPTKPKSGLDLGAGKGAAASAKAERKGTMPEFGTEEWLQELSARAGLTQ